MNAVVVSEKHFSTGGVYSHEMPAILSAQGDHCYSYRNRLPVTAANFNHANLKSTLPKFHQHVVHYMRRKIHWILFTSSLSLQT